MLNTFKISRRDFVKKVGLSATALFLTPTLFRCSGSKKLNFVFILADDLGWKDLECFGSSFYETPNLNHLASEGMRFTQAYAACPVCSPTRASIMTGKYPARLGTTDYFGAPQPETMPKGWRRNKRLRPAHYLERLPLEEVTVAEAFKKQGYATFFAGKWHLGGEGFYPEDQGFDINKGGWERGGPYGGKKYFSPYGNPKLADGPDGEHLPDRLASETCDFIEDNKEDSFFAYLSFYSVHTPLISREDLKAKYEEKVKTVNFKGDRFLPEGKRKARQVQDHAVYAGMVEAMDLAVGKVLDKLDELNLSENTVVVFMSDNGGLSTSEGSPTSNVPLRAGKGWLYEGGIREPMIVRWPGVTKPNSQCVEPVISTDFYPTMLEIAGFEPLNHQHVDGVSFAPVLRNGGAKLTERALFWHYPHYGNQGGSPGSAVRFGDYKLIQFYEDNRVELYNLREDIGEKINLASKKPEKMKQLKEMLNKWLRDVDAKMPSPNPDFGKELEP